MFLSFYHVGNNSHFQVATLVFILYFFFFTGNGMSGIIDVLPVMYLLQFHDYDYDLYHPK